MLDNVILRFLIALKAAEDSGQQTSIYQLGYDTDESVLRAFTRSKEQYFVMGEPRAAWITPAGRKVLHRASWDGFPRSSVPSEDAQLSERRDGTL